MPKIHRFPTDEKWLTLAAPTCNWQLKHPCYKVLLISYKKLRTTPEANITRYWLKRGGNGKIKSRTFCNIIGKLRRLTRNAFMHGHKKRKCTYSQSGMTRHIFVTQQKLTKCDMLFANNTHGVTQDNLKKEMQRQKAFWNAILHSVISRADKAAVDTFGCGRHLRRTDVDRT